MSADEEGARKFVNDLDEIIMEDCYRAEQRFNVDETGLFWKRMPARTYTHKEAKSIPGFKASKDRLTLLYGGNIAGLKFKPFVIYHNENQHTRTLASILCQSNIVRIIKHG